MTSAAQVPNFAPSCGVAIQIAAMPTGEATSHSTGY